MNIHIVVRGGEVEREREREKVMWCGSSVSYNNLQYFNDESNHKFHGTWRKKNENVKKVYFYSERGRKNHINFCLFMKQYTFIHYERERGGGGEKKQ